jgi:4a-hydroxytetrahydrobiopterin dehydratase
VDDLTKKKCVPCEIGTNPMSTEESEKLRSSSVPSWSLVNNKIEKKYTFKDFVEAIGFVNHVAEIAESEGHHPDIFISYNKVTITLWTHVSKGLTLNDFIVAAKIEKLKT